MIKKTLDTEIDLFEVFLAIWNSRYKVLSITVIVMIIGFVIHSITTNNKNKIIYNINSEIQPISAIEETKYNTINSYIYNYYSENKDLDLKIASEIFDNNNYFLKFQDLNSSDQFRPVTFDKSLFFKFFITKISSQKNLEKYLEEFKLLKKDDYLNSYLLIESFSNILNSTKKVNYGNLKPLSIQIKTYNYEQTLEFFNFLNERINLEVKNEINKIFNNHIETVRLLKKFKLDDIKEKSEIFTDANYLEFLEQTKKFVESDKYLERINVIYSSLPLSNSKDFYAGKVIYQSSSFKNLDQLKKKLILLGLTGIFLGIIIVLISNAIKMRKIQK